MLKVSIDSTYLDHIPYVDKKGANATLIKQTGYLYTVDPTGAPGRFPEKFEIMLPRKVTDPYPVGEYELHPSCIEVVAGRATLRNVRLVALRPSPSK